MSDLFHEHLDICQQCRDHPFDLCSAGATALALAAMDIHKARRAREQNHQSPELQPKP